MKQNSMKPKGQAVRFIVNVPYKIREKAFMDFDCKAEHHRKV